METIDGRVFGIFQLNRVLRMAFGEGLDIANGYTEQADAGFVCCPCNVGSEESVGLTE